MSEIVPTEGGCLCGRFRYRIGGPIIAQAVCHCRNCQKQSGSAFSVILVTSAADFTVSEDPPFFADSGESGNELKRYFCDKCGSPLYSVSANDPNVLAVKAGTLDKVDELSPKFHLWCASAWPWTPIPDGAVKMPKGPPERRRDG